MTLISKKNWNDILYAGGYVLEMKRADPSLPPPEEWPIGAIWCWRDHLGRLVFEYE